MQHWINWLSRHRTINILLVMAYFFAVVGLHDAVTVLAIQLRRSMSVEGYNLFFTLSAGVLFLAWTGWLAKNVIKSKEYPVLWIFLMPTFLLILLFFLFMQTYAIEAVHFFQYALLTILLFPLLRSYGAAVFWATMLGVIDELFQYQFLTPDFAYFDLNDIMLNLLGAGLAAATIYLSTGIRTRVIDIKNRLWIVIIFSVTMALTYGILYITGLVTWYPSPGVDAGWFSVNRSGPENDFWTLAYPGKYFHILRPREGFALMIALLTGYWMLDYFLLKYRKA